MAKRSGVSFEISTVIFVLVSLTYTKGDVTRVSAFEGEKIELNFRYPSECAQVTLRNEMRALFYDSANLQSLSLAENHKLAFQHETESSLLKLRINSVLRSDVGGYILTAFDGDGNIEDTMVGLSVDYPPGKASCQWEGSKSDNNLVSMRCKASAGSMQAQIVCSQNGVWVVPTDSPMNSDSTIEQTIWMRYSQPAFCCALAVGQSVDRCKCKDYTWNPHNNQSEPCPVVMVTTHQEPSTSSQSPTAIPSKEVTQNTQKNHRSNVAVHVIYSSVIGMLAIIIIGLCIALTICYRKVIKSRKNGTITYSQPNNVNIHEYDNSENIIEM